MNRIYDYTIEQLFDPDIFRFNDFLLAADWTELKFLAKRGPR